MTENNLLEALEDLAEATVHLDEEQLAAPWRWGSYNSEGLRFAFFRLLEELDGLNAALAGSAVQPESRRILGAYNRAYFDLQAITHRLSDDDAEKSPGGDEWDIRTAYAHILGADYGFFALVAFALEGHHAGAWSEDRMPGDADYDRILDLDEAAYNEVMESRLSVLRGNHREIHRRVLQDLSTIADEELELPSRYWEEELYPLRFRLLRFASHLRQHSIQIEKTRPAVGLPLSETEHILRRAFRLYADIETQQPAPTPAQTAQVIDQIRAIREAVPDDEN